MIIGIVVAVVVLLVGAAALYDRRAKRRGQSITMSGIQDVRRDALGNQPQNTDFNS